MGCFMAMMRLEKWYVIWPGETARTFLGAFASYESADRKRYREWVKRVHGGLCSGACHVTLARGSFTFVMRELEVQRDAA